MGLFNILPPGLELNVIIAGGETRTINIQQLCEGDADQHKGGTAGCIVASRLAQADPGLHILVIEGGTNNQHPTIETPAFFFPNLSPEAKVNIFYQGNPSDALGGRAPVVPSGGYV